MVQALIKKHEAIISFEKKLGAADNFEAKEKAPSGSKTTPASIPRTSTSRAKPSVAPSTSSRSSGSKWFDLAGSEPDSNKVVDSWEILIRRFAQRMREREMNVDEEL